MGVKFISLNLEIISKKFLATGENIYFPLKAYYKLIDLL